MVSFITILVTLVMMTSQVTSGYESDPTTCSSAFGRKVGFLFSDRGIPDGAFSANSVFSGSAAYRARLDDYNEDDAVCAWVGNSSHTAPYYVEVDTETPATAFGIVLMKRCDNVGQYTKTYKVQVFSTGVWKTVHEEGALSYSFFGNTHISWFAAPVFGSKWRFVVTDYNILPIGKFDLIGYI